jgi:DNA-binding transcriptional regulator YiaG
VTRSGDRRRPGRARASWSFTSRPSSTKALRRKLGKSQARFAKSFGFGLAAVQS